MVCQGVSRVRLGGNNGERIGRVAANSESSRAFARLCVAYAVGIAAPVPGCSALSAEADGAENVSRIADKRQGDGYEKKIIFTKCLCYKDTNMR